MKNLVYLAAILLSTSSCTALKKGTGKQPESNPKTAGSPRFLEHITIKPSTSVSTDSMLVNRDAQVMISPGFTGIETCTMLRFKYGILMNMPVESLVNDKLLEFLDDWYGTPYRFGGTGKSGIDCSAFTSSLLTSVYGVTIPRSSREQYSVSRKIKKTQLQEGDLVFFNTRGRISHVGVYLGNNKFAHASTSSGVMISDLDESYFSKRFAGSGRVREISPLNN